MNNIRLRFAPSPTGFLHIGNLRTALFGYLIAKSLGGDFILRIEDTDQKRETDGAVESLIKILNWVGINFTEGPHLGGTCAPYIQTERLDIYQKYIKELLDKGEAYYCFCTAERLDKMREEQQANKQAPRYDRCCRNLNPEEVKNKIAAGEPYVIRQKMPLEGDILIHNELRGDIKFAAKDLDDHVLIKSDGIPTYQFANIVDDHLMKITHVTRGDEWLSSFPKNILLYRAFGWEAPKFIHLPLILNKTGGKLSKRQGDVFVENYKDKGYLPEAIINFCALLGWHSKDDRELYLMEDLEKAFNLKGMGVSPAVFDLEKLDYFNGYYLRQKSNEDLLNLCLPYFKTEISPEYLSKIITVTKDRLVKLEDIVSAAELFLENDISYDSELLKWKQLELSEIKNNLEFTYNECLKITTDNWTKEYLENHFINYLKETGKKPGDYLWPMRVALTGAKNSPSPFEVAWVLGKDISLNRIKKAIDKI